MALGARLAMVVDHARLFVAEKSTTLAICSGINAVDRIDIGGPSSRAEFGLHAVDRREFAPAPQCACHFRSPSHAGLFKVNSISNALAEGLDEGFAVGRKSRSLRCACPVKISALIRFIADPYCFRVHGVIDSASRAVISASVDFANVADAEQVACVYFARIDKRSADLQHLVKCVETILRASGEKKGCNDRLICSLSVSSSGRKPSAAHPCHQTALIVAVALIAGANAALLRHSFSAWAKASTVMGLAR